MTYISITELVSTEALGGILNKIPIPWNFNLKKVCLVSELLQPATVIILEQDNVSNWSHFAFIKHLNYPKFLSTVLLSYSS